VNERAAGVVRGVPPPHYMHVCEKRGVAKWAMRKCVKREGLDAGVTDEG